MTSTRTVQSAPLTPSLSVAADIERFMEGVLARNPHEPEFHQAVHEVAESVMPLVLDDQRYRDARILEQLLDHHPREERVGSQHRLRCSVR